MIEINCHSSIKLIGEKIIYIDPFKIDKGINDADIILITHDHYDHFSEEDIIKVIKNDTIIVAPLNTKVVKEMQNEVISVEPNKNYEIKGIKIETIPAYNIGKPFHPKANNWVGYIVTLDEKRYYIAGDTDITEENKEVKCDIALLPIGGTYTMNTREAAQLANILKPQIVIPIHYGCIVGKKKNASEFKKLIDKEIQCEILIKC